jgi:hypothetical protein
MRYFKDLSRYSTKPLRKVAAGRIAKGGLRGLDSFVIADKVKAKALRKARTTKALKRFVKKGGNLVLTDAALKLLPRLGVAKKADVRRDLYNAGHLDITGWDDRYLKGVHTTARQTYYEVPLGYSPDEDASPHWTVAQEAWDAAKGKTLAYIEDETRVGLGRVKLGRGTVGIIGALLPPATEKFDHFYGLVDYAVSPAGGTILHNMLGAG